MAVTVTAVVPTVGASPLLGECLRALRAQRLAGEGVLEIVLVRQGPQGAGNRQEGTGDLDDEDRRPDEPGTLERELRLPRNLGFAAATNRGIALARGPYVAAVNDDVVVEEGWLQALVGALEAEPRAAAAQGVNLQRASGGSDEPPGRGGPGETVRPGETVDGWGLGWNRVIQAIQLGRDASPPDPTEPAREVFGVSATAAVYRRSALLEVARRPPERGATGSPPGTTVGPRVDSGKVPEVFDSRLESYYEDADLACRLRAAGYTALTVPAARALHAGSLTGDRLGARRWRLLYGNRYAVAAGLLGRALWPRLPRMLARDAADLVRGLVRGEISKVAGIIGGWGRGLRLLPAFAHNGAPIAPIAPTEGNP